MKRIQYSKAALKTLRRIPANEARRIRLKIEQYAADPASQAQNVRKLQNREGFRLRVGDWRVIFADDGTVIDVIAIGPRGGIYE
jgi:mRNA interferase RelE/StbE